MVRKRGNSSYLFIQTLTDAFLMQTSFPENCERLPVLKEQQQININ